MGGEKGDVKCIPAGLGACGQHGVGAPSHQRCPVRWSVRSSVRWGWAGLVRWSVPLVGGSLLEGCL